MVEIEEADMTYLIGLARRALIIGFGMVAIMLFHILVDFFYHS